MSDALNNQFEPPAKKLNELKELTRKYARFSKDAVGLGHVIGGGLLFLSAYLLLHRVQLGIFGRLLLGAAPFGWIFAKEWLRDHYYQFSGRVTQRRRVWEKPLQALLTGVMALICLIATGFAIYNLLKDFSWWLMLGSLVYIAVLLAIPFIVWRYLRAPYEFIAGAALFLFSAFLLSTIPLSSIPPVVSLRFRFVLAYTFAFAFGLLLLAQIVALVMVPVGLVEHLEFLKLRRKMRALEEAA